MLHTNIYTYCLNMITLIDATAFSYSLVKGFFFGLVIAVVACRKGMLAEEGAIGVGKAVRSSLVVTSVALFTVSYLISSILRIVNHFAEIGRMLYL
jgi:phospholipid/cholesterol/gamma-HCH transport system permease protein